MPTPEQQEIWRKEKEQMIRDKNNQGREIRRRPIELKLGKAGRPNPPPTGNIPQEISDDILRKRLGI